MYTVLLLLLWNAYRRCGYQYRRYTHHSFIKIIIYSFKTRHVQNIKKKLLRHEITILYFRFTNRITEEELTTAIRLFLFFFLSRDEFLLLRSNMFAHWSSKNFLKQFIHPCKKKNKSRITISGFIKKMKFFFILNNMKCLCSCAAIETFFFPGQFLQGFLVKRIWCGNRELKYLPVIFIVQNRQNKKI